MKRREALALVATLSVPLAGCSSSGDGDETNETPSTNETPPDNATEDPPENTTDPSDDGNSSDGGESDEPEGPTEEELAQEDIDAAQDALSEAVSELENQGDGSLSSGDGDPPVTAGVSGLSAGPVRDELSSVQSAIDDAREHETTGDQEGVLDELETAKDWLHTVLGAYQPLRDLYLEANYALQDYVAEDASADLQAVRREADQAQSSVDDATDPYATPEANGIDAIATDGVEAQVGRLAAELESGRSVADAIEVAAGAEAEFGAGMPLYEEDEWYDARQHFDTAEQEFESAASALPSNPTSYSAEAGYLTCYLSSMETASESYRRSALNREFEDAEYSNHYKKEGEAALEDADACSLD